MPETPFPQIKRGYMADLNNVAILMPILIAQMESQFN